MTSRNMGDSTNHLAIPTDVQIAALYDDGSFATQPEAFAQRFPHDKYGWCIIDVTGALARSSNVRDWETGDKEGSLEQWVIDHNDAAGKKDAVVYCNRATIPEVRQLTGTQILGTDYFLWVSTLDGTVVTAGADHLGSAPYTYPGVIACQVKGAGLTGGDWDQSLVYDGSLWLPVTPPPPPKPAPKPQVVTEATAKAAAADAMADLVKLTVYFGQS